MSLRNKTIKGTLWTTGSSVVGRGLQLVSFGVLGRLLGPKEFGMMALALFFVSFARMFVDMGFGMAIVQRKGLEPIHLHSAFWVTTGIGILLWLGIEVAAEPLALYSKNPGVLPLLRILSFIFIIDSIKIVPESILLRTMKFNLLFIVSLVSGIVYAVVSISLAFLGHGVYSLVIGFIVSSLSASLITVLAARWMPRLLFSWQQTKGLLQFGVNLSLSSFLGYISNNIENFLLGKYVGVKELGLYHFSTKLVYLPRIMIAQNVGKVVFPAFSKIQDDGIKLKKAYLLLLKVMAYVSIPVLAMLAYHAEFVIVTVFGAKWLDAVVPMQILAVSGVLTAVSSPLGNIYLSKGKSGLSLKISIVISLVTIVTYGIVCRWGLLWICYGSMIIKTVTVAMIMFFAARAARAGFTEQVRQFVNPALVTIAGIVVSAIVLPAGAAVGFTGSPVQFATLILSFAAMIASFVLLEQRVCTDAVSYWRRYRTGGLK